MQRMAVKRIKKVVIRQHHLLRMRSEIYEPVVFFSVGCILSDLSRGNRCEGETAQARNLDLEVPVPVRLCGSLGRGEGLKVTIAGMPAQANLTYDASGNG